MERIFNRVALLVVHAACLLGCATVTRGSTENLVILTEPDGALVRASIGWSCTTPCEIQIKRRSSFIIDIHKEGYEKVRVFVKPTRQPSGNLALTGNIIFGGLIGLAVDGATGAASTHLDNPIQITLETAD